MPILVVVPSSSYIHDIARTAVYERLYLHIYIVRFASRCLPRLKCLDVSFHCHWEMLTMKTSNSFTLR